ncbi:MAG: hypothetical protein ACE5EY_17205, partial [Anaerolineae bacterium]
MTVIWSPAGNALVTAGVPDLNGTRPGAIILWQQEADGRFHEQFRTRSIRAGYTCCNWPAPFNPSGTRVAMEKMHTAEAVSLSLLVFDLEAREVVQTLREYELGGWQSDDLLLTAEAQGNTRRTLWDVQTGASVLGMAANTGDDVV